MIRPTAHAPALHNLVSARLGRSQFTRQAKNAHLAGQQRTKHAIASQLLVSATLQRSFQRPANAQTFALIAPIRRANVTKVAGLAKASMPHVTTLANVLLSWDSVMQVKNRFTHLARSALLAGIRRTRHVTALQQSVSASLLRRSRRRAPVRRSALDAPRPIASATRVGLARASQPHEITHASVLRNSVFVMQVRRQSTHPAKNAHRAGQRRTPRACVLPRLVSATKIRRHLQSSQILGVHGC